MTSKTMPRLFAVSILLAMSAASHPALGEELPFSDPRWTLVGREHRVETFEGRETLFLQDGGAYLEDVQFLNGTIEFELMVGPERGFSGVRFRVLDGGNYEDFYIRPHQSGKVDANQYQPVFNGNSGWQIYFGPEYSAAVDYPMGEWIHLRLDVLGDRAQVHMNGELLLVIDDLKHETLAGAIGLSSGWAGARFANFRYLQTDNLKIAAAPTREDTPKMPRGLITEWTVSDAVAESILTAEPRLPDDAFDGLQWHTLTTETNGVANLARIQSPRNGPNTTFVRLRLHAERPTVQRLDFGFSDRVRVYVNGDLHFYASDRWQSRDYRFLGTVGLHDAVYCHLQEGDNEVVLAVSESFGGWAVMGTLNAEPGVTLRSP